MTKPSQSFPSKPSFQCLVFLVWYQFGLILDGRAGVAVGVHQHLGVGVDRDELLNVPVALHKVHDRLDLGLGVSSGPTERL